MSEKPSVHWMEGLLTLFNAPFPYEREDPRLLGFFIGQQIIGLYAIEMLLKYALDNAGTSYGQHHNLQKFFKQLSPDNRRAVEKKYIEILNSKEAWTWDIAKTANSLLQYLGKNAITDTRYFPETDRAHVSGSASILFAPRLLYPLVYALFIELHNYPNGSIEKRYDTKFESLAEALKQDQQRMQKGF